MTSSAPSGTGLLPALKLAAAGEFRPVIVIDTRENTPLTIRRLESVRGTLTAGDYSLVGAEDLFAVERKSIADLAQCCTGAERKRFARQLQRLRGCSFRRLLIVGHRIEVEQRRYRSNLSPKAILSTLAAFEVRYDVPVVWANEADDAAALVERWGWWFAREAMRRVGNLTALPNNRDQGGNDDSD